MAEYETQVKGKTQPPQQLHLMIVYMDVPVRSVLPVVPDWAGTRMDFLPFRSGVTGCAFFLGEGKKKKTTNPFRADRLRGV